MKIISMKQLRQKFSPMRKGLERGEEYLLMYRSKPLAVVRPYEAENDAHYLGDEHSEPIKTVQPALKKLPDPKTVSFGSRFTQTETLNHKKTAPMKPLEKLRMRRAFL
jgi:hypothetical protein